MNIDRRTVLKAALTTPAVAMMHGSVAEAATKIRVPTHSLCHQLETGRLFCGAAASGFAGKLFSMGSAVPVESVFAARDFFADGFFQ